MFPSPHGVISISTKTVISDTKMIFVSVPSRGYLYIYSHALQSRDWGIWFPSPHGVISISTRKMEDSQTHSRRFRPLTGLSLYLPT